MPYQIEWHIDKRVVYERLYGKLTGPELQKASDETSRFLHEGISPVHLIIDMSDVEQLPITVRQATGMTRYLRDPNLGWLVVIGGGTIINFMVAVTSQVINYSFARRESIPDAMDFLAKQDKTLEVGQNATP